MRGLLLIFLILISIDHPGRCQAQNVLFHWSFDETIQSPAGTVNSAVPYSFYEPAGHFKQVPGILGLAGKFDGYTAYVDVVPKDPTKDSDELKLFRLPQQISVEAWVALGAYPWNWAPIITMGKYGITGFYLGIDAQGRASFQVSDGTSTWHECSTEINPATKLGLELNKWYHLVATFNGDSGITLYVNGEPAGHYDRFVGRRRIQYGDATKGFRMGMNYEMMAPSDAIRNWATFPSRYSLYGIIDEVKIYKKSLSSGEVQTIYQSMKPAAEPGFGPRRFPTVKPSGRFAASYTRLSFYPEWDALWPVGDYNDVVVQFDELPTKIMFWRGTRYSPCLVTENGKWMADQSRETGYNWFLSQGSSDDFPTGCMEHMSDVQTRSSRVSIIENTDARVVVNWRYLQMDVKFRQQDLPDNSGFGEWGNELYYIYPDGVTVRKVLPGWGGWQETIFLNEPGTRPEDNVDLAAVTLLNMKGEKKTYSWEKGYPKFDLQGANIQVVNMKSKFKPYLILHEGGSFSVFNGEVRPEYSHFPWWNHWPVAQISSDGRSASSADHASHSSLSWGDPVVDAALYGLTDQKPENLIVLARSWIYPPEMRVLTTGIDSVGYDFSQRAYRLEGKGKPSQIDFSLSGSPDSPVYNPAFIIRNYPESECTMKVDGRTLKRGPDFRYGFTYDVEGVPTLLVWIKMSSEKPVQFQLGRE